MSTDLEKQAKKVLQNNWIDLPDGTGFTKPSGLLYPFQWSWDSMFIAIGYSHYDLPKAQAEIRSLFSAQWSNGLLPHIVFHSLQRDDAKGYFPGPDVWDSQCSAHCPRDIQTSGIIQPPVHAHAVWAVYQQLKNGDEDIAMGWLEECVPVLLGYHRYLYTHRDPEGMGLVTIYHPWESGMDNSPRWDDALSSIKPVDMSSFTRRDIEHVDPNDRPSDEEYGKYMAIVEYLRSHQYDDASLYDDAPFKVKDIAFSSILSSANQCLLKMLAIIGGDMMEVIDWIDTTKQGIIDHAFNEKHQQYYDRNVKKNSHIQVDSVASAMPLIADVLKEHQREAALEIIDEKAYTFQQSLLLSYKRDSALFEANKYWRGPVWYNINWLLYKSFVATGDRERSSTLLSGLTSIVSKNGFWEYYDANTGDSLGGKDFGWTAALYLDTIASLSEQDL